MMRNTPNTEAIIVEYGFLDNKNDAAKLKNNYKSYADAVVDAVLEYKGIKKGNTNLSTNEYKVQPGDSLWSIAKKYNTTVEKLKEINNLNSNLLSIGQIIYINKNDGNQSTDGYVVKKGDTLYSIALKNGISVNDLINANNLNSTTLSIGQNLTIPTKQEYRVYTVKPGDTLFRIASANNTTVEKLKELNNITGNIISIGQKLLLP